MKKTFYHYHHAPTETNYITSHPAGLNMGVIVATLQCEVVDHTEPLTVQQPLQVGMVCCTTTGRHVKILEITPKTEQ